MIDFPARLLSAGQRRRVALARLMVAKRPASGCSTSRRPRSTPLLKRRLPPYARRISKAAGSSSPPCTRPLGLDRAQELRLGAAGAAAASTDPHLPSSPPSTTSPTVRGESSSLLPPGRRWLRATRPDEGPPNDPCASPLCLASGASRAASEGAASVGIVFFLILVAIMPFALGPDLNLLARLGLGILWIAALLATLL